MIYLSAGAQLLLSHTLWMQSVVCHAPRLRPGRDPLPGGRDPSLLLHSEAPPLLPGRWRAVLYLSASSRCNLRGGGAWGQLRFTLSEASISREVNGALLEEDGPILPFPPPAPLQPWWMRRCSPRGSGEAPPVSAASRLGAAGGAA